jgi:8-oxo-dGTP pyrophosphatase MutT (NUDIX family)
MKNLSRAVVAIIENDGKILIGKKRLKEKNLLNNAWHIPGGKNLEFETDIDAIKRELFEETGLNISIKKRLAQSIQREHNFIVSWYLCFVDNKNQTLKPGDDLTDAYFAPKQDLFKLCDPKAVNLWPRKVREYLSS